MFSTTLYNISTAGYVASLAIFATHLVNSKKLILKAGVLLVALSFLVQTGGMVLRWMEAGQLEVSAAELAVGQTLTGWSWFVVFTQHPPWSNLYEIMVYMSWGIIMVTLFAEISWRLSWVRHMGMILALMALGMAALTDAAIKPLVPALKSWWIMIHVISASIAYAAGSLAAVMCWLALMKDQERVNRGKIAGFALVLMGVLLFALGGGPRLFSEQAYFVKLLAIAGEGVVNVLDMAKDKGASFLVPMPGLGWPMLIAVLTHILGGLLLFRGVLSKYIREIFTVNFLLIIVILLSVLTHDLRHSPISVDSSVAHHLAPATGYFISFKSHTWSLGLLILLVLIEMLVLLFLFKPSFISDRLPAVNVLENSAYKAISLAFFLMSIVLITGALWAHYAWGRYWAWDPKETGALAIWITYAIYLHARRTSGLAGPVSSLIGVLGFFVIIIGFLGVNLGLFADGLHTYGNS